MAQYPIALQADLDTLSARVDALDGGSGTQASPPLTNLSRWFKADAGVTMDGSNRVSAWADQSGNGANATQATGGNQPLYVASVIDGLGVLRFSSGRTDNLAFDLTSIVSSDYTIAIVHSRGTANAGYLMGALTGGAGNSSLHIGYSAASTFKHGHWGNDIEYASAAYAASTFQWFIVNRNASYGRKIRRMGVDLTSGTDATALGSISGGGIIGGAVGTYYTGDIAEVLVYNAALSRSVQDQLGDYLRGRYPSCTTALAF